MYTTIISTSELNDNLKNPDWRLLYCRFSLVDRNAGLNAYNTSHISGAQYVDLEQDLSSPITTYSGRHPLPRVPDFVNTLQKLGIDHNTQVVVYDDTFGPIAGRLWWMLNWLGHDKVALLDGGFAKWTRENRPIDTDRPEYPATVFNARVNDAMLVDTEAVSSVHGNKDFLIVDARSEQRYLGLTEPLDKVAGHIPNAVCHPNEKNLDGNGVLLEKQALLKIYTEILANRKPEHVIMMCGSGVTACHNLLAMQHAGLGGAKLYAGSWSAWISNPELPVESIA